MAAFVFASDVRTKGIRLGKKPNLIILTHGWTGSSVYSALVGEVGYWTGSETVQKNDYDTFENADLVTINSGLLERLAPGLDHEHRFEPADVMAIGEAAKSLELDGCRQFLASCDRHSPWVWKDPRLTWTIRVWARLLSMDETAFLILTRDDMQAWISANIRRHVQTFRFTKSYNHSITALNLQFARESGARYATASFEDLLLRPQATVDLLNKLLGVELKLDDVQRVCREPLYKKTRGVADLLKACLILAKNYGERDGAKSKMLKAGRSG